MEAYERNGEKKARGEATESSSVSFGGKRAGSFEGGIWKTLWYSKI